MKIKEILILWFIIMGISSCQKRETKPIEEKEVFTFSSEDEYTSNSEKLVNKDNKIQVEKVRDLYDLLTILRKKNDDSSIQKATMDQIQLFFNDSAVANLFINYNLDLLNQGFIPHEIILLNNMVSEEIAADSINKLGSAIDTAHTTMATVLLDSLPPRELVVKMLKNEEEANLKVFYELYKRDSTGKENKIIRFKIQDFLYE